MPIKHRASILLSARNKPKPVPPSTRKVNTSELGVLLHQHLDLKEDETTENNVTPTNVIEHDTSMLVNSTTAKDSILDDLCSVTSTN